MAELADAHGSGPCGSNTLRVQVPSSARSKSSNVCIQAFGDFFVLFSVSIVSEFLYYDLSLSATQVKYEKWRLKYPTMGNPNGGGVLLCYPRNIKRF